ncbi:MAG: pyridoxamine 5'-phosphate oxidase [Gemmataceae bacterium]|nr:pyridoxamine 5'-phosphate oxidase [Gemmataceae bacterium]
MSILANLSLDEASADPGPFPLFARWYADAENAKVPDFNALTLATSTPDGHPSARIVLLRGFDERGFAFYTNYESRKGCELDANPHAAMVFFWTLFQRQVRIEGSIVKQTPEESDAYFSKRPAGHRLGALVSPQSRVIPDRAFLEHRMDELTKEYQGQDVPRPDHWGGYRLVPHAVEFWQGRENRLHDRLRYRLAQSGWIIERLAP